MKKYLLSLIIFLSPTFVFPNSCEILNSTRTILECALINHPDLRQGTVKLEATKSLESIARQRPNPEVNSQTVWATTNGNPYFYTEYNFAHTFELGGKRDSRIQKAKSEVILEKANNLGIKEKVYLSTLLSLYRIRQLRAELDIIVDAIKSFSKIRSQYTNRPRLNPEQRANLKIFEIAESNYRMRHVPIVSEIDYHLKKLEYSLGKKIMPTIRELPIIRKSWPELSKSLNNESQNGYTVKLAEANVSLANSELSLSQSNAWPDLKIGPTFELQNSIGQNFTAYGFNFILPLPFYHRNESQKYFATLEIQKNKIALEARRKESIDEKEFYSKRYITATLALKSSPSLADLARNHQEIEKLFEQGLIPGNLVIEIHRQIHDFIKTFNEQETTAAESLTRVYMLEEKLPEEIIW
jgi:outer membrane protein TolC